MNVSVRQIWTPRRINTLSTWQTYGLAICVAAVLNILIALVGRAATGEFPRVDSGDGARLVTGIQIVVVTVLVGLAAWAVHALLERFTARPDRVWWTLALILLAISLVGPLGSGTDGSSKVLLALMHLVTAALIIPAMQGAAASRTAR